MILLFPELGGNSGTYIYPNPARDRIHIVLDESSATERIEIWDAKGKTDNALPAYRT